MVAVPAPAGQYPQTGLESPQADTVSNACTSSAPCSLLGAVEASISQASSTEDGARVRPPPGVLQVGRKCTKTRGSRQPRSNRRVYWDEQIIAEHDKERGTRQKIDEPDTPFVRSPQKESDSEGGPMSSDDEQHRLSFRQNLSFPGLSPESAPQRPVPKDSLSTSAGSGDGCIAGNGGSNGNSAGDVDPQALARRLDLWMRSGGNQRRVSAGSASVGSCDNEYNADAENSGPGSGCSSRSSSSARHPVESQHSDASSRQRSSREERRISLPEESPAPKPASDSFKAKRAQHYNEIAALKAYKPGDDEESCTNSDTSDENQATDAVTKTNTNTNINSTMSTDNKRHRRCASGNHSDACDSQRSSQGPSEDHECASRPNERGVSFSGGESGGESSEEFRSQRHQVSLHEWAQADEESREASSVETNTNTNLNAGQLTFAGRTPSGRTEANPMEAGRPPVRFDNGADPASGSAADREPSSSEEFRGRRQRHYDEVAAVRRFRAEARSHEPAEISSSEADGDEQESAAHASSGNPMEPRDSDKVAFRFVETNRTAGTIDDTEWRMRRQAHYNEMAAALRSAPPPSDDEDEDDESN
eukprot:TRINITY_DN44266_c0_g1_i1.p1 TRINITY_DN44266_c0_g1~~TRINITY_DN44266_c0_g1_i1.p1  ORF type:complete len:591 (+),score=88.11 TRINITY_DN44266_c0_g1_i1:126-1898(+)